uniref:Protein TonB n=1 Tax=Candidatus Kentrum sp. FW TaxID=2126338 RepID=A0A450S8J1_9GAMM|nr:MAG: protein TonB [Candidatus Kentron sp. FW]VFJ53656.1 MAG: protein TonB [Candidatus Kentron sp. FW]
MKTSSDHPSVDSSARKIASLPIGFFLSGFLHLTVLAVLVISLSGPIDDSLTDDEAPLTLTLAMFAEPEPVTREIPAPPETPPQAREIEKPKPEPKPKAPPLPPEKPKPRPVPKKTPVPRGEAPPTRPKAIPTSPAPIESIQSASAKREEDHYLAALRRRIERRKYYPRASQRRGEEGKVVVSFVIRKDGELTDLAIVRSSGIQRLDEAALKTLRRITPFEPIPAALGRNQWALSVPISYSLQD